MFNVTQRHVTVFNPEVKGKYVQAQLSTPKKEKNEENPYSYQSWFCKFVGEAVEEAKKLKNQDRINVTNAIIENEYVKESDKNYVTVTIFNFEKEEKKQG